MSRNRNNVPITIDVIGENTTRGITFNYSENFNRVIEFYRKLPKLENKYFIS